MTISQSFLEDIEFFKIVEDLISHTVGEPAGQKLSICQFELNIDILLKELTRVKAAKEWMMAGRMPDLIEYRSIEDAIEKLKIVNFVLELETILALRQVLFNFQQVLHSLLKEEEIDVGAIREVFLSVEDPDSILKQIDRVIDEFGVIKDTASDHLKALRKIIQKQATSIDRLFEKVLAEYQTKKMLSDPPESIRGGRRVLCVPAENKRKINGIIHDVSSTNQTVYIEPNQLVQAHNELFNLRNDEQKEIYKILQQLTTDLSPFGESFEIYASIVRDFDCTRAKAKQAVNLDAQLPKLVDHPSIYYQEARHPILLLRHRKKEMVIPFTMRLYAKNRQLVISGPNAGGKTIVLKAVGLLQCMLQFGCLIPVDPDSQFGVFRQFFADIGDHQSIEQDLSTYSSHLQVMKDVLQNADEKSLILIDEMGSGTDPDFGGAIAQAILEELLHKKSFVIISTHYSSLKNFAHQRKGVVNASMLFDKNSLTPLYQLTVGKPGSSYAFEVAEQSGLNKQLIKRAKKLSGKQVQKMEELLVRLEDEKLQLEQQQEALKEQAKNVDRLVKNYENMQFDLTVKKKKFALEQKRLELNEQAKNNKELEKVIREIRENQDLNEAKKLAAKIRNEKKLNEEKLAGLQSDIHKVTPQHKKKLEVGDFVRFKMGGISGQITSINKKKVIIQTGTMTVNAKLSDLEPSSAPIEVNPVRSVKTTLQEQSKVYRKLEIIGLSRVEALKRLEKFFDNAIVANLSSVEIIHGRGNGVLRKAVKEKISEYDFEVEIEHPEPQFGGEAVSIIRFHPSNKTG